MRILSPRSVLTAIVLTALAAPAVRGDLLTTQMDTHTPIITFRVPSEDVNGESGYVGPNSVSFDGSASVPAYCTDLFRSIHVNDQYAAHTAPLSTLANGDLVAKLFRADAALGDHSALEKAALQLAVWDVVETGRAGLGGFFDPFAAGPLRIESGPGSFSLFADDARTDLVFGLSTKDLVVHDSAGSGVLDRMDSLLLSASTFTGPGAELIYIAPDGSYGQGFVSSGFRPVPEPSSLLLSCLGLVAFIGLSFRRRLQRNGGR